MTSRRLPLFPLAAAAVLLPLLIAILRDPIRINIDAALYLQAGDLMRAGAMLYVDVIDTNPPMIDYLNVLVAALARALGAPLIVTFMLLLWSLTAASSVATYRLSRAAFGAHTAHAAMVALSVAIFSAWVMVRNDYGQREHLFVLALMPYLAMRICRCQDVRLHIAPAVLAGVFAAVTACLKPHFVVIVLAVEAYLHVSTRKARLTRTPEFVAFVLTGLAYAAHFAVLPPAIRDAWFGRWLPLIASGYSAYDMRFSLSVRANVLVWLPPTLAAMVFADPRGGPVRLFARALVVAALAGVASFFAQKKGWPYHGIPAEAAMATLLACVAGAVIESARARLTPARLHRVVTVAGTVLAIAVLAEAATAVMYAVRSSTRERLAIVTVEWDLARAVTAHSLPHDTVLVISTSAFPAYPVLTQFDRQPGSRYLFSFPLPMIYDGVVAGEGQPFPYDLPDPHRRNQELQFRREMQQDIEARKPAMIMVGARACQACPQGFDLDEYLRHTGFLRDAMREYQRVAFPRGVSVYDDVSVYVRGTGRDTDVNPR